MVQTAMLSSAPVQTPKRRRFSVSPPSGRRTNGATGTDVRRESAETPRFALEPTDESAAPYPDIALMKRQSEAWRLLLDYYFRLEMSGWNRLPERPSMLVGIHSGTWLTMDAWTLCAEWWRRFGAARILHGTAHDVLLALPALGSYFRKVGVIPASRTAVSAAFAAGRDVVVWPGGELDAMRSWTKRDTVVLGGRTGFIRQAIRSGVPIVPVATVGGHDTVFVLSEGRRIAELLHTKEILRSELLPIVFGFPFGILPEVLPLHIPLPAKIRTELLDPIELDGDPERASDDSYVRTIYAEVEHRIQEGVDRLAQQRRFHAFG